VRRYVPGQAQLLASAPEREIDISPDQHLDRAVAWDRAAAEPDLLDPAAPRE
jgi:hypothetical protein